LINRLKQMLLDMQEEPLRGDEFAHSENRAIFEALMARGGTDPVDIKTLRDKLDRALLPRFDALLQGPASEPVLDDDQAAFDLVAVALRIRQQRLRSLIQELRFLSEETMSGEDVRAEEYGEIMRTYTLALRRIHQALAARSALRRQVGTT